MVDGGRSPPSLLICRVVTSALEALSWRLAACCAPVGDNGAGRLWAVARERSPATSVALRRTGGSRARAHNARDEARPASSGGTRPRRRVVSSVCAAGRDAKRFAVRRTRDGRRAATRKTDGRHAGGAGRGGGGGEDFLWQQRHTRWKRRMRCLRHDPFRGVCTSKGPVLHPVICSTFSRLSSIGNIIPDNRARYLYCGCR